MSFKDYTAVTPRRSTRITRIHTPKMSDRKKGLFQNDATVDCKSLTKHRQLPIVNSESDTDDCDLGISTLDSSSSDEIDYNLPSTPERGNIHNTRSGTKLLKENKDLRNFMRSPYTLHKFQTRYSRSESKCAGSLSTPSTPPVQIHPGTPSSTHSCASVHTVSSTTSRARKSLASLIADAESCSSSLKDLNFDTDSGTDTKENTPTRRSTRKKKMTPKFQSFKGVLAEQVKNSPVTNTPQRDIMFEMKTPVLQLTKLDMNNILSPSQMLKTPHKDTITMTPPKLIHNRRAPIQIDESSESNSDCEKRYKRLRENCSNDGPNPKNQKLGNYVPKARLSLFNSDKLKEMLTVNSFYGKSKPELNPNMTKKIVSAIETTNNNKYNKNRSVVHYYSQRRKRRPGQINKGVRHRIRKPKFNDVNKSLNSTQAGVLNSTKADTKSNYDLNRSVTSNENDISTLNTSQEIDKPDPFDKVKRTIDDLLSQWTEEEIPETELRPLKHKPELPCFNKNVIEETNLIFQAPVVATPVITTAVPENCGDILELGVRNVENTQNVTDLQEDVAMVETGHLSRHGDMPIDGEHLPVEGGYLPITGGLNGGQEELIDLDAIEREMEMLDAQILNMAQTNNMNPKAVFASIEGVSYEGTEILPSTSDSKDSPKDATAKKLFSIFETPNPGTCTSNPKGVKEKIKKPLLKSGKDQYIIDAGQKRFGVTQCVECGVIYHIGDPQDEIDHMVHHNATNILQYNSVKGEKVVGQWGSCRVIRIRAKEPGWKKVISVLEAVINPQLGCDAAALPNPNVMGYTAYLYVEKRQIIGCLIVEPKLKAYKMIPGDPDCCSREEYPVKCGVSRLWTHLGHRRRGIARTLLDSARLSYLYGAVLETRDLAFSAPTAAGKLFATKYCQTENFYVYM